MKRHTNHLSPLVCDCRLTHPSPDGVWMVLLSMCSATAVRERVGRMPSAPRDVVASAWSLPPVNPLYSMTLRRTVCQSPVQGEGAVELIFKLRRLVNIKCQLATEKQCRGRAPAARLALPEQKTAGQRCGAGEDEARSMWGPVFTA